MLFNNFALVGVEIGVQFPAQASGIDQRQPRLLDGREVSDPSPALAIRIKATITDSRAQWDASRPTASREAYLWKN